MNAIKKTKSKRLFSMLLALMMCLTMLPTTAWAVGELTEPLILPLPQIMWQARDIVGRQKARR